MTHGSDPEPSRPLPESVFVGRGAELTTLRAGLDRAIAGRGCVVLVAGEPGIGKSELADRLARDAAARGGFDRATSGGGGSGLTPAEFERSVRDNR